MHRVSCFIRCSGVWPAIGPVTATALASGLAALVDAPAALATSETDCAALGRAALQVELTGQAPETRHVALRSGETLRFSFEAEPGPHGRLTLIEGAGAPRPLLAGPSGTSVAFTAQRNDAFGFRFANAGEVAARFRVTCERPLTGGHASAPPPPLDPLADVEAAVVDLEIGEPYAALADGSTPGALSPIRPPAGVTLAAPGPAAGSPMKMQWLDQHYAWSGPEGSHVDPRTSGMEIGVNYKLKSALTIGALAQVNPAAEIVLGAQRSLAEQGWMAGPVTTLQLAPGLMLDARAAWGEGGSGPAEAATTAAQRSLVSARLAKQHTFGAWRLTPRVNFNYQQETLSGASAAADAPAAHATGGGRIDLGPELVYRTDLTAKAFIEPRALVGGFWDFGGPAAEAAGTAAQAEMRLRAEAGVTIGVPDGPKLQASGVLEEGIDQMPDAWSGRLQLSVPLK
jgi:hypothetical protein